MLRKRTIQVHFMRNFIYIMLFPIMLSAIIQIYLLYRNTSQNAVLEAKNSLAEADSYFNFMVQNTEYMVNAISFDQNVQELIISGFKLTNTTGDYEVLKNAQDRMLLNFTPYYNFISNVVIFNKKGELVLSLYRYNENANIYDYEWSDILEDSHWENIWFRAHIDKNDLNSYQKYVVTMGKKIMMYHSEHIDEEIGYLVINLKAEALCDMLNNFLTYPDSDIFIQNKDGKIALHKDSSLIDQPSNITVSNKSIDSNLIRHNGKMVLLSYCRNEKTNWVLVQLLNYKAIFLNNIYYIISTGTINIILLIVVIASSVKISKSISKPIYELQKNMEVVEKGNFKTFNIKKTNIVEIDRLIVRFRNMVNRLNSLIEEVYKSKLRSKEMEAAINKVELEFLQQQINPHFLYNTLDSINWLSSLGNHDEASSMITALSEFFRYSINKGIPFVTIFKEVESIKRYIYLQQIRFGPKLVSEINVEPGLYDCLTLNMLLQPIVENAILHGIQAKSNGGKIEVRIYKKDDSIFFVVADDGIGMDQNTISKIISPDSKEKKIGLRNVKQRLSLFLNNNYSFNIESEVNKGTTVTVSIPCAYSMEELRQTTNN